MDRSARQYWDGIALRWRIAEPLAPGREDLEWFERRAEACAALPPRALLLGVTAGIATMRWPGGTRLLAADWSAGMLKNVWPASGTPVDARVVCADWRELPVADASFDLALGDGCYTALAGMDELAVFNAELRRVLARGAHVLMRCFCRPARPLEAEPLFDELLSGRLRNLDLFRWLLAMAVHGASRRGVTLQEVWRVWTCRIPDARAQQARLGWPEDGVTNMERWANSAMVYTFPALDELRELAAPAFEVEACDTPSYAWGELFPRLVLRAR